MKTKRLFIILLAIMLIISGTVTVTAETETFNGFSMSFMEERNYGNFNYWNQLRKNGGMLEKPNLELGDVTLDGTIDARDALFTLQYAVNDWMFALPFRRRKPSPYIISFERAEKHYYSMETYKNDEVGLYDARFFCYLYNSSYMADVNNDLKIDSVDALMILQCAIGKREFMEYDFFDYTTDEYNRGDKIFFPWPDDWKPRMIYGGFDDSYYDDLNWPVK